MRSRGAMLALAFGAAGLGAAGCRTAAGPLLPDAVSIVEGATAPGVLVDTTEDSFTASLGRAHWRLRDERTGNGNFWDDISRLDVNSADRDATDVDERTFVAALRSLMTGDPEGASVAFGVLREQAHDSSVRARARVGLTMALTWSSDWNSIAALPPARQDSLEWAGADSLAPHTTVDRWARAFAGLPPASVTVPAEPSIVTLRRSSMGTPIVRVRINGHPHEFWLDTGASMTIVSSDVARSDGVKLAAHDTLALGVVGGNIAARAVYIDSLSVGRFVAHGVTAALVSGSMLRLDYRMEDGQNIPVHIDGVLGSDLLRHMDLVIDADAGTVSISRPRRDPHAVRNLFWIGFPVVRLVSHDGRPLLFGLDTGAESTFVTKDLLHKLPRTRVAARRGRMNGLGDHSERTEWVAREIAMSDGEYAINLHSAPIAPDRHWTFVTFDGIIGSDIALGTRLHLDFQNGVFDIRPTDAPPPQPYIRVLSTPE